MNPGTLSPCLYRTPVCIAVCWWWEGAHHWGIHVVVAPRCLAQRPISALPFLNTGVLFIRWHSYFNGFIKSTIVFFLCLTRLCLLNWLGYIYFDYPAYVCSLGIIVLCLCSDMCYGTILVRYTIMFVKKIILPALDWKKEKKNNTILEYKLKLIITMRSTLCVFGLDVI